jgi:hypothetical protein
MGARLQRRVVQLEDALPRDRDALPIERDLRLKLALDLGHPGRVGTG